MWPCFKGTQLCLWVAEARNENLSLTHWGGIKALTGLLWPLQKVNSQKNEPYLLLQDLSPGFGLFTPKITEAGLDLRMSCDSKSLGRSSLLHFIGSCCWWKQSCRVLLGHHGHMKNTDGPNRSSQDSSAVPETAVTETRAPSTALECAGCSPSIKDSWDGRHEHYSGGQACYSWLSGPCLWEASGLLLR